MDTPENVVPLSKEVSLESMNLTDRIEVLNAFRSIRDQLPKLKKVQPEIERYVHTQFVNWIDSQIKGILGEPQEQAFSPQEITVLKALASKVQQRQPTAPVAAEVPQKQQTQKPTPTPLRETVDVEKFRKSQEDFLRQLEAMDRNAPQF